METFDEKYEKMKRFIKEKGKNGVVVAFSGGIDSSTLAAVSHNVLGAKAVAVTATSPTYTPEELEEAKGIAKEIGIKLIVVETDELLDENFVRNPENRCYYCKKELLKRLLEKAGEMGFETVFEGTNFSDLADHRPGFKAVKEMKHVYCPWFEMGFTKEEIRGVAERIGLSVRDKPANACLASRIPFHERITREKLKRIGLAEQIVRELTGIRQLRVRDHNGLARIEVKRDERNQLCDVEVLDKIVSRLKRLGFKFVTVDAEGYRTGSMLSTLEGKGSGN
ncbi:MAG TPA: ATP-dependent sacrificial sulfur transferase LarE [Candidatus Bathyarchaeia archaeon]|nr:ATP-dependent sacrificial sulfur transferase LarE [Candidatus Bathyarchaeia archaeon]